jgi:hypothetical protein
LPNRCGLVVKQKANGEKGKANSKKKKAIFVVCSFLFAFCSLSFPRVGSHEPHKKARCVMRAILALFIALAVAFILVGTSAAAPGGEVKASPLFKRSLEESIAKLEGKAPEATAQAEAEAMPTGRPGCPKPNQLQTEAGDTCYDSCSGTCFATCGGPFTCGGSTCGGETCSSTCAATCAGSGPTYQGGACCNASFYGTVSWLNTYWGYGPSNNWSIYLSPYNPLRDFEFDNIYGPDAGLVQFKYGSDYSQGISIDRFYGYGGYYAGTPKVPNVSSYRVLAWMDSYYYPNWNTSDYHDGYQQFSGQPSSSQQVNLLIPINRP